MSSCGVFVIWVLMAMVSWAITSSQEEQQFDDEMAGIHIDNLSERGIETLLKWRKNFLNKFSAINESINFATDVLDTEFIEAKLPNLTQYVLNSVENVSSVLETAESVAASLNLTDQGDGLIAFMKTPHILVNVKRAYNRSNRAGGTFTAPQRGLYQVIVRTIPTQEKTFNLVRNDNETIFSTTHRGYYDVKTRIRLLWLNPGDEIFVTGYTPAYFGVILLRVKTLMPTLY